MPYDASLDAQIFTKSWESDTDKVTVSVYSYNNGPRKVQIVREIKNREGEYTFTKLGRLSKDELQGILPSLQEALKSM